LLLEDSLASYSLAVLVVSMLRKEMEARLIFILFGAQNFRCLAIAVSI
jgi:hypothetical protein